MKTFFGGQIIEKCRGDLAVVIARDQDVRQDEYDCFLYDIVSQEFIELTGIRSARYLPDRVYIGVTHDAGEQILREAQGRKIADVNLRTIDQLVVIPHFMDIYSETAEKNNSEKAPEGFYKKAEPSKTADGKEIKPA